MDTMDWCGCGGVGAAASGSGRVRVVTAEPHGHRHRVRAVVQHAAWAGRHAGFRPCGVPGPGRISGHARHAAGRCRVVAAHAAAAVGRRCGRLPCGHSGRLDRDQARPHGVRHDHAGAGRADRGGGADVPASVRRRGRHQCRPLGRPRPAGVRFWHTDAGVLRDRRLGAGVRVPDVAHHADAVGAAGQRSARQCRAHRLPGL